MKINTHEIPSITLSLLVRIRSRQLAFHKMIITKAFEGSDERVIKALELLNQLEQEEYEVLSAGLSAHHGVIDFPALPDGITPPEE